MPDIPPAKRRPDIPTELPRGYIRRTYAELHCKTNFSFLEGASHADELVNQSAKLGLSALAITDRNSLAGVVRAHVAARDAGVKLIIGAEMTPVDSPPVVLLATDRSAYANLSTLITVGRRQAPKGECRLTFGDVAHYSKGLIACLPLSWNGQAKSNQAITQYRNYRECFQDRCYGMVELLRGPHDGLLLDRLMHFASTVGLPLVAANDVHYHVPERQSLQDVLTAIRHGCTVAELGDRRFPNAERHLKPAEQMEYLFSAIPDAVARTVEIADRCTFSLEELRYEYPKELCPKGMTSLEHLTRLTWQGARSRFPDGVPAKVAQLIRHELQLISELRYEAYFLTVWDLVCFARSRGILCQGRGSAANSAVCFCLGVTEVDPSRIDVLFERFVSKERNEPPDIDVDFEHERREEVIQYVYEKYGRDRAGMTAVVITYRMRSAVRDVGKALGFSQDCIDRLAKSVDHMVSDESLKNHFGATGVQTNSNAGLRFYSLVREILHFPRHLSQHVGGLVITRGPLHELVPIENAAMADRTVVQWDKDDLDALGLLKVDCLALGMLSAIRRCFDLIARHEGRELTLAEVPPEDPQVYDMISEADTIGVFQIESRAQMSMLPRLRPRCYYDLVIEVAIVRPGPIQGDMVHPYLRRRCGLEPVEYPDERIREVLHKTLGVPIFQEQAMRLSIVAAGFTPGEADQLRRAMGAWRRRGVIDEFRQKLINGMVGNGYDVEFAERVFRQLQGFGEYGFPESHASSFALLVYVSAWLKRYYPAAFTAALLNSQPMGFYAPAQLISDVRRHDVEVRPVDVGFSDWDCTLEPNSNGESTLRMGFRMIKGMPTAAAEHICACRRGGPFASFEDFRHRTGLGSGILSRLSRADAFRSLAVNRRQALWHAVPSQQKQPLFDGQVGGEPAIRLPPMGLQENVIDDYRTVGLSLRAHPLQAFRGQLQKRKVIPASGLATYPPDRRVRVAGLVLIRQHPGSANGITFVTLEDETGTTNLIIRPDVWNRFRQVARTSSALLASGLLQREQGVIHVMTDRLEDLSTALADINIPSRDFR